MKAKRRSKAQKLSPDRISTLPQNIIEIILCFLPIIDAARTSVLSTEWRYKWTTIPKLVVGYSVLPPLGTEDKRKGRFMSSRREMDSMSKVFYAIYQVLLLHQGPIHEFTLSMYANCSCYELDHIILHLSRNHPVKKLELVLQYERRYRLPLSVFSMHHLTDLHLEYCDLHHKPTFSGFGSLRTLYLKYGTIPTKPLLHLLSNCPTLKSFTLFLEQCELGNEDCTVTELFECLPMLEHLTTWSTIIGWLVLDSTPKELSTLTHLKYFCFEEMCFECCKGLSFIAVLLKCSPNLKKIKIKTYFSENDHDCYGDEVISSTVLEEYSDVQLEHLNELEIKCLHGDNVKSGMEFVRFILTRSPKLQKVSIVSLLDKDHEFMLLKDLLGAPRVSPVKILVHSKWEKKPFRSIKFPKY